MENISKEQLVTFINILLHIMEDSHIYIDELFEDASPEELEILALTDFKTTITK